VVTAEPPKYRSSTSVGKRQTVPIDAADPRLKKSKRGITQARTGAEITEINTGNVTANYANFKVGSGNLNASGISADIIIPPINNLPPSVYPGGSGAYVIVPTDPSNVSAVWSGDDLIVSFTWDPTISENATMSQFIISLTNSNGITKTYGGFSINASSSSQTLTVTASINEQMFNIFTPTLTSILVKVADPLNNTGNFVAAASIPTYVLNLPTPSITLASGNSSYSVSYTTPTSSSFSGIDIWEIISTASSAPAITYATDGITPTNYTRVYFNKINPAIISTTDYGQRWVVARFSSNGQIYTAFSTARNVTPTSPVVANVTAPGAPSGTTATTGVDPSGVLGFTAYINLSWTAGTISANTKLAGYRIRFTSDTGTSPVYSYADSPGTGTTYKLSGLSLGTTYQIAIASYDFYNNVSTYTSFSSVTTTGTAAISSYISTTNGFQFGAGVGGTTNQGLYLNSGNYWYLTSGTTATIKVGGTTSNYISWNGGDFTIDGNIVARKGSFSGNVSIASGGSLYSGTIDASGNLTNQGYILQSTGIIFNSGGVGTTTTTITGSSLTTTSANIGGWVVNSSTISKTGITGKGNIVLDSSNGYIYVSSANTPNYNAGINSPSISTDVVFWAGQSGTTPTPSSTSNDFRVRMDGKLYANNAEITGIITAKSAGTSNNTITLDATNDYISLATTNGGTSYILQRNSNLYITAPSASSPFSTGTTIPTNGPTTGPYFAAGNSFSDYWSTSSKVGAGLFTGAWNYFTGGTSSPFITATSTGIQLSASPAIGILLDAGTAATGTKITNPQAPSMLIYTAKDTSAPYSPSKQYGAWATFESGKITLNSNSNIGITMTTSNLQLSSTVATNAYYFFANGSQVYQDTTQSIKFGSTGLSINGLNVMGDNGQIPTSNGSTYFIRSAVRATASNSNAGVTANDIVVGYAIYYSTTGTLTSGSPSGSAGYIGDLWVAY